MFAKKLLQHEAPSARRSTGCSGCRYAKKGCDMQFPVCGRCLRLSQACYRRGAASNIGKGVAYGLLDKVPTVGLVDQHIRQADTKTSDKKASNYPRALGDWSDIMRYFAEHKLIRGLVAACRLQTAVSRVNGKEAANIYGAALSWIREAIQGEWQVADDAVLVVTLLLYVYERFYWPEQGSSRNWIIHIQGAISLVRARGLKQVQTKVGRVVFRKARDIILDVSFCTTVLPPHFLILGSQGMGRDVLYHAHDQLAILETRTIVLYQQYCRGALDQAFIQAAHTLQHDLTYRQKTAVYPPCNSPRHRRDSVMIDGDKQQKEEEYLIIVQDLWSGAKLQIFQLVVCRIQSAVFRRLWNTIVAGSVELVSCCQICPTRTSEIMCSNAASVVNDIGPLHLPRRLPSTTLGMHGAIFTASSCLESELEELTSASSGVQSDAMITPSQMNSMRKSSQWLTAWSRMLAPRASLEEHDKDCVSW